MEARNKKSEGELPEVATLGVRPEFSLALENFNRDIEERLKSRTRDGVNAEYLAAALNVFRKFYPDEVKDFFDKADYEELGFNVRIQGSEFRDLIESFEIKDLAYYELKMKSGDRFFVQGYHMRALVEKFFKIKREDPRFFLMLCRVVVDHYQDVTFLGLREKIASQVI